MMKRPAVFVDRDGTINEQMGYINHVSRFTFLPGTAEAIKLLNIHRFLVIVISNQSGVARGYFPIELVNEVHSRMKTMLEKEGAWVDAVYFCPHHPSGNVAEYRKACDCRKPATGMVRKAIDRFDIDLKSSYVIGDRLSDIEMAERLDLKGILVRTGYGRGEIEHLLPGSTLRPVYIADDLLEAVKWIIKRQGGKS